MNKDLLLLLFIVFIWLIISIIWYFCYKHNLIEGFKIYTSMFDRGYIYNEKKWKVNDSIKHYRAEVDCNCECKKKSKDFNDIHRLRCKNNCEC